MSRRRMPLQVTLAALLAGIVVVPSLSAAFEARRDDGRELVVADTAGTGVVLYAGLDDSVELHSEPEPASWDAHPPGADDNGGAAFVLDAQPPELDRLPEVVHEVPADYPEELIRQGIAGTVSLEVLIVEDGSVESATVVQGIHPVLDSSAAHALRAYRFTPALLDSEPVAVVILFDYSFSLHEVVESIEQYVNLSGRLLERGTRAPVVDAMVVAGFPDTGADSTLAVPFSLYLQRLGAFEGQYVEDDHLVTLTDSVGRFRFFSLPVGPVVITIPAMGYRELQERESIGASQETIITLWLERVSYTDYEVVVYGRPEPKEVSRRQLTLQEVKTIPGLGGDAVRVVQALPGVARPTFGGPAVVVRGAGSQDSRYYLDGVEIPLLFHFGGLKSTYQSDALAAVDFYPGGFSSRYGGAVGGVIEITGRPARTDRWHGYADANFLDGSLFVEGPVNSTVSVLAGARRSFIGDLIAWGVKQVPNELVLTTAPYYWDYLVRTDIALTPHSRAWFTLFGVNDGFKVVTSNVRGGSTEIDETANSSRIDLTFHMGLLGWDHTLGERVTNRLRLSLTRVDALFSAFNLFRNEQGAWNPQLRNQLDLALLPGLTLQPGLDGYMTRLDLSLGIVDGNRLVRSDTISDWWLGVAGGYLNLEWQPRENILIMPGVRYDFFPELTHRGSRFPEFWDYRFDNTTRYNGEPSLRLTGRWDVVPAHTVKMSVGNYSQAPQPYGQAIHPVWGNPKLGPTRAAHYVLGHEWRISDLIHTDVQAYINRQWNLARSPPPTTLDAPPYLDDGRARMHGVEVMLRHDPGPRFFGWLAYSLSRSERYDFTQREFVLFGKDQTHNLIAVGSWTLPREWKAGFRLQYTTGDPETPLIGTVYREEYRFYEREYGPVNSERLPPTLQLDLRFDKRFVFRKWMLGAYVDFFNIGYFLYRSPQITMYNNAEPYDYRNDRPNRRFVYQYSLPSIGLKAEF